MKGKKVIEKTGINEEKQIKRLLSIFSILIDGVTAKELVNLTGYSEEKVNSLLEEYHEISNSCWGNSITVEELEQKVIQWAKDRGIYNGSTELSRFDKLLEEASQLLEEIQSTEDKKVKNIKLEAGVIIVTLINVLYPYGLDLKTCLEAAYEKIKNRKGRMENGVFVKEIEVAKVLNAEEMQIKTTK